MIDNREGSFDGISEQQINRLCDRHFGIGADGLILLQLREGFDFFMNYHNADGKPSSMCGNGSRCTIAYAHANGIKQNFYHFLTADGPHEGEILADGNIRIKMGDVAEITDLFNAKFLDTGSPHYVTETSAIEKIDVKKAGSDIRFSPEFAEKGVNVNFVEKINSKEIKVRTYERGVEDETLSCGTGVTACSIANSYQEGLNEIMITTPGGVLNVEYKKDGHNFTDIWLKGPVASVFHGTITI